MYYWTFNIIALSNSVLVKIDASTEETMYKIINGLFGVFGKIDVEKQKLEFGIMQKTPILCESIKEFVSQYSALTPTLNKLNDYFKYLAEGEYFYFLPEMTGLELTPELMRLVNANLIALRDGKDVNGVYDELKDYWKIREVYSLETFGKQRESIGEPNREERTCRFCRKGMFEGVTFKNKAHAISEALGNKSVVLYDECDQCNIRFSKTIEPDLISFLSLYRTMFSIKGKGGVKDFKGKLFHVTRSQKGLEVNIKGEPTSNPDTTPYTLRFHADSKLVSQNIYKTLCKYFLSVIKSSELDFFKKTIDWINGNLEVDSLPVIAELKYNNPEMSRPILKTYIMKNKHEALPYAVGEFHFTAFMYVFIVPLCSEDKRDFSNGEHYLMFWDFFRTYHKMGDWAYRDFSAKEPKDFGISLKFVENDGIKN